MNMRHSSARLVRLALVVLPGSAVLATSCAQDIRNTIVLAGLDFVEGAAGTLLEAAFPVGEILTGN